MKSIIKNIRLIGIAVALPMLSSCIVEIENNGSGDVDEQSNLVDMTITAGAEQEEESKAGFSQTDYPSIHWQIGDNISVIGKLTGNQIFTTDGSGASVDFEGKADHNDQKLYAVYPYDANITFNNGSSQANLLKVTIPSTQTVTAGTFDPRSYIAVAQSDNEDFSFKSLGAFFKFRLENAENVKFVRIEANQGANKVTLAGTAGVSFDSKGIPTHGISGTWGSSTTYVELTESQSGDKFESGVDYFVVTRANICPYGITVYIGYDNGTVFKRSTTKQVFPSGNTRNCIVNLGVLDINGDLNDIINGTVVDFSYAGYDHGQTAPSYEGYTTYNVETYGAIANDGKSDREAFLKTLKAALGGASTTDGNGWIICKAKQQANAIIYFPEGEYILHDTDDTESIVIPAGNIVLKGAGRDKTTLIMKTPMQPANSSQLYSSPKMLQFKHNSGRSTLATVVGDVAVKGSYRVQVNDASGINAGDWVCLYVKNNSTDFISEEVAPYEIDANWTTLKSNGVEINDYHQVKAVDGNTVEFVEPLMHAVDPKYNWEIQSFPHYENVGIEDLCFKGNAVEDFEHHKDWNHDGGYKPLSMQRLTNSWIRRVDFVDISEACSIIGSANVSAYDIQMSGHRGHSAIRSEASSRVLIAATTDITEDLAGNKGNFHGVGVSKHTLGTVLWRNKWGDDSCFESHTNQPRATLIDCCSGGWHDGHMGGNYYDAPHHLADLTIWNFTATDYSEGEFGWWKNGSWKFLPPIIVGFKPATVTFNAEQVILDEYHGQTPHIESLYEEQLSKRLGYVPSWLNEIKTINY